jgi:hypothetical protein
MPIPDSGPISLADIAAEFGGSAPLSLSEYYGAASGIPAGGEISVDMFRGLSSSFQHTITANQKELNLRTYLLGVGWNGSVPVEVVIASGVYIWSDNTSVAALDMGGAYSGGLTLTNNGFIMGKGGAGGYVHTDEVGFTAPTAGGPSMNLTGPITINNSNGYIGGGGGGGAALTGKLVQINTFFIAPAYSAGGGGAGGGNGGRAIYGTTGNMTNGGFGAGGAIGQNGSTSVHINGLHSNTIAPHGGGGGASGAGSGR